jgi:hypothetical protein
VCVSPAIHANVFLPRVNCTVFSVSILSSERFGSRTSEISAPFARQIREFGHMSRTERKTRTFPVKPHSVTTAFAAPSWLPDDACRPFTLKGKHRDSLPSRRGDNRDRRDPTWSSKFQREPTSRAKVTGKFRHRGT